MNTEIKGIVRYGEEQLGDGIVRPSADITAQMIVTHIPSSEACQRRRSVCWQEVHRSMLRLHLFRNTMVALNHDCVTIVPAHDGPLQLEFFGNGKLKSKKGNEMCWYRQTLSQSAQPIPVRHPGLAAWRRDQHGSQLEVRQETLGRKHGRVQDQHCYSSSSELHQRLL